MTALPKPNENNLNLLVSYSISSNEEVSEAIINAFHAAHIDVFEKPTELFDWVDVDTVENIQWTSGRSTSLSTQIWDHQVVITADEIRIYTSPAVV